MNKRQRKKAEAKRVQAELAVFREEIKKTLFSLEARGLPRAEIEARLKAALLRNIEVLLGPPPDISHLISIDRDPDKPGSFTVKIPKYLFPNVEWPHP